MLTLLYSAQDCAKIPEEWRPVKGYEGLYEVSNHGHVRSVDRIRYQRQRWSDELFPRLHKGRLLSTTLRAGYPSATLSCDGQKGSYLVHHLVMYSFVGQGEPGEVCNHKDGNRQHNCASNLEWVTPSGNVLHALKVLQNNICRAKRFDLRLVCTLRQEGASIQDIASRIGASIETIRLACLGKHWSQVDNPLMNELPPTPWKPMPPKECTCAMCHQSFPYEYFATNRGDARGYSQYCPPCLATYQRNFSREWARKRRSLNPGPGRGACTGIGEFNHNAITPDISAVLALRAQGLSKRAIAFSLQMDPTTVWRIINGKHWSQRQV